MKNIFTFIIACFLTATAITAQQETDNTDYFKAIFGVDKITIVQDFINVDASKKDAFWSIYSQYESDRKVLRTSNIALISDYAENYESLTDEKLDALCKESIKQKSKNAKLIKKYYKKLKKAGGSKAAAQFLQVENYFLNMTRAAVSESIPFIGELDKI